MHTMLIHPTGVVLPWVCVVLGSVAQRSLILLLRLLRLFRWRVPMCRAAWLTQVAESGTQTLRASQVQRVLDLGN
jgi:hypothetical protein